MKKAAYLFASTLFLLSTNLFAQRTTDIEGGKDYPLISRFKGSVIEWQQQKNFDRYFILTLKDNKLTSREIDGKITRIQYSAGKEHSAFEIGKSYENALQNAGFEILTALNEHNCETNLSEKLYIGEFDGLNQLPAGSLKPDFNAGFYYLNAKKAVQGKDVYLTVYVTYSGYPLITFDAVEVQSMDTDLVTVKQLDEGISQEGHIAIYGIYFDSGKSAVKPESAQALKNIAEYINAHANKKFIIVGHTDNTGSFDSNIKLSKERASAVMGKLTAEYGVRTEQLRTYGDGSTAPVTSNATEDGKAKNRRVEIVEL